MTTKHWTSNNSSLIHKHQAINKFKYHLLLKPEMCSLNSYNELGAYCRHQKKLKYYFVNRGDGRSGTNKLKVCVPQTSSNPSWDFLLAEDRCRLIVQGLYSNPIPFHFIPALGRVKGFWLGWQSLLYIHTYVVWVSKNLQIVCLS